MRYKNCITRLPLQELHYTAPADGYVVFKCRVSNSTNNYQAGVQTSYGGSVQAGFYGFSYYGGAIVPISKGQWFKVYYESTTSDRTLKFIYAVGSEPTE